MKKEATPVQQPEGSVVSAEGISRALVASEETGDDVAAELLGQLTRLDFSDQGLVPAGEISDGLERLRQQLDELLGAFQETVRSVHRGASNACEFSEGLFRYSSVDLTSDAEAAQFVDNTLKMVADRAEEVGTAVRAVAEDSSVSKNSVDSVASTTVQLSNASKEIAENTEKARAISEQAVVDMDAAARQFEELTNAAAGISMVTNTIREFSDQTKLLALNATIEAARAGEAGRGFAVVANEVKELASQTSTANKDIKDKVEIIQNAIGATLEAIKGMSDTIASVNEIVASIAAAAEQQSVSSAEIAQNVSATQHRIANMHSNALSSAESLKDINGQLAETAKTSHVVVTTIQRIAREGENLSITSAANHAQIAQMHVATGEILSDFDTIRLSMARGIPGQESAVLVKPEKWLVGPAFCNDLHSAILEQVNRIHGRAKDKAPFAELLSPLKELSLAIERHGREEARFLAQHGDSRIEQLTGTTEPVLAAISKGVERISAEKPVNAMPIILAVFDWLKEHVDVEHKKLEKYMTNNDIKQ